MKLILWFATGIFFKRTKIEQIIEKIPKHIVCDKGEYSFLKVLLHLCVFWVMIQNAFYVGHMLWVIMEGIWTDCPRNCCPHYRTCPLSALTYFFSLLSKLCWISTFKNHLFPRWKQPSRSFCTMLPVVCPKTVANTQESPINKAHSGATGWLCLSPIWL